MFQTTIQFMNGSYLNYIRYLCDDHAHHNDHNQPYIRNHSDIYMMIVCVCVTATSKVDCIWVVILFIQPPPTYAQIQEFISG